MIKYSDVVTPTKMTSGTHFKANQFSRLAFKGLSGPVLNIDQFEMNGPTFAAHPHAGFSAVTYLFESSIGGFVNRDSLGNTVYLHPGSTHWTRASRGIVHEELPIENGKTVKGLQIFFNLPASHQNERPAAFHVSPDAVITQTTKDGVRYRVSVNGTKIEGQPALAQPALVSEVTLPMDTRYSIPIEANFAGVLLVVDGQVEIDATTVKADHAVGFKTDKASEIVLRGLTNNSKVVLVAGESFEQAVFQRGPFILASQQQLDDSIQRFQSGEFGQLT